MYLAFYHVLKRTFTFKYPYEVLALPETYRGKPGLSMEKCIGCGLCAWVCPPKALQIVAQSEKKFPELDLGRCCMCGLCSYICPTKAMIMTKEYELSALSKDQFKYGPLRLSQPSPVDERGRVIARIKDGRGVSHVRT